MSRAPSAHHQMVRALVVRLGYLCHSTEQRIAEGGYVATDLMREADGLAWALDQLAAVGALDVEGGARAVIVSKKWAAVRATIPR